MQPPKPEPTLSSPLISTIEVPTSTPDAALGTTPLVSTEELLEERKPNTEMQISCHLEDKLFRTQQEAAARLKEEHRVEHPIIMAEPFVYPGGSILPYPEHAVVKPVAGLPTPVESLESHLRSIMVAINTLSQSTAAIGQLKA